MKAPIWGIPPMHESRLKQLMADAVSNNAPIYRIDTKPIAYGLYAVAGAVTLWALMFLPLFIFGCQALYYDVKIHQAIHNYQEQHNEK